jgi:hypothetical protein
MRKPGADLAETAGQSSLVSPSGLQENGTAVDVPTPGEAVARSTRPARRTVLTALIALAIVIGLGVPAQAAFSKQRALPSTSIATATLTPPTKVSALLASCSNGRWMTVTVSWSPSTFSRVTGYVIQAYRSDGQVMTVGQTSAGSTSAQVNMDKFDTGLTSAAFTVTATLSGWTAESSSSATITC